MKVIHVVGSIDESAGGPSRSVPQTCEYLSKIGVSVLLVTRPSKKPVSINKSENFKLKFLKFFELIKFGMKVSSFKPSLIHLQHVWDPYIHVFVWFAQRNKIPYIITPRGMLEPWIMSQNKWKKKLGMFLYQKNDLKKANYIHSTCQLEHDNIRNLGFDNNIEIIPNGVDLSKVKVRKETFGTNKIVFMSRIHRKKGIELLLDVWNDMNVGDWNLEIAGDGDSVYIKSIQDKINNQKINNVNLVGAKYGTEKWEFIKSADLFVLPTFSENFGIVVAESLAVGVPVITTSGTPWEELNSKNCGWCIDLTYENLKKTMELGLSTPKENLKIMGENGRKLVNYKYDIKSVAKNMKILYGKIINNYC